MVEAASRRSARKQARSGAKSSTPDSGALDGAATRGSAGPAGPQGPEELGGRPSGKSAGAGDKRRTPARLWNNFLRNRSVRVRVLTLLAVPLLAASLLGGVLLGRAVQDALSAQRAAELANVTSDALVAAEALQDERDATALNGGKVLAAGVTDARATTDSAVRTLQGALDGLSTTGLPEETKTALNALDRQLESLPEIRTEQDYQQQPFDTTGVQSYLQPIRAIGNAIGQMSIVDPRVAVPVEALTVLGEAAEQASTERALTAWILQRGELASPEQAQTIGALRDSQDNLIDRVYDRLPSAPLVEFKDGLAVVRGPMASARSTFSDATAPGEISADDWYRAATDRLNVLRTTQASLVDEIVTASENRAANARLTAILTLAALVIVLVVAIVLTLAVARSIVRPLRNLQAAALRTAKKDLPDLVERVKDEGPKAVRSADSGLRPEGNDEIGRVASAFNEVYGTAVRVAGEQALLRQNLDSIVVNLSRRTQSLVDRQLREIEQLEGSERDPDQLATLFRIDHLATRVQRHAESLLVLAGVDSSTKSPEAVSLLDVVRAAAGEVEQYDRVRFGILPTDLVAARAVDDVAHLVAELLDNATEFSPPATTVLVDSQRLVGGSLRITVADQGLGVPAARLAELNERLTTPGDIDVAASRTLGLYVVARLAGRHGIAVRLEAPSSGGTIARIDLPAAIVNTTDGDFAGFPAPEAFAGVGGRQGDQTPAWNIAQQGGWTPAQGAEGTELPRRGAAEHRVDLPPRPTGAPGRPAPDHRPAGRPEPIRERRVVDRPGDLRGESSNGTSPYDNPANGLGAPGVFGARPGGGQPGSALPRRNEYGPTGLPQRGFPGREPQPGAASAGAAAAGSGGAVPDGASVPAEITDPLTDPRLRVAPQPGTGEAQSPIYTALRSSWFRRASADPGAAADWTSPADEGFRTAAAVSRYTESISALPRNGTAPAPEVRRTPPPAVAPTPTPGAARPTTPAPAPVGRADREDAPAPATPVTARTSAGLPMRPRGASLVPGAIADTRASEGARDAAAVRANLSTLIGGVARGRETTHDDPAGDEGDGHDESPPLLGRPDERNDQ